MPSVVTASDCVSPRVLQRLDALFGVRHVEVPSEEYRRVVSGYFLYLFHNQDSALQSGIRSPMVHMDIEIEEDAS